MNIKRNIIFALEAESRCGYKDMGLTRSGYVKAKARKKFALFSLLCRTVVSKTAGLRYD